MEEEGYIKLSKQELFYLDIPKKRVLHVQFSTILLAFCALVEARV